MSIILHRPLPREGTIARTIIDRLIKGKPSEEHRWSELKKLYDSNSDGDPQYTSLNLSRILRTWSRRSRRGVYVTRWIRCGCAERLLANDGTVIPFYDQDGVEHALDSCVDQINNSSVGRVEEIPIVQNPDEFDIDEQPIQEMPWCACKRHILKDNKIFIDSNGATHEHEWCQSGHKEFIIRRELSEKGMSNIIQKMLEESHAPSSVKKTLQKAAHEHAYASENLTKAALNFIEVDRFLNDAIDQVKSYEKE